MKAVICALILSAALVAMNTVSAQAPKPPGGNAAEVAASTYEHLATAIIAIEKTEDELVKSILIGYETAARMHLRAANGADARKHFEAAANDIVNIANEGDKRIQAIRQRLAQAGHTHNTDADTKEDYMFINNKEKKQLLALAQKVATANPEDAASLAANLAELFTKAIAAE